MGSICKIAVLSNERLVCSAINKHFDSTGDQVIHEITEWPLATEREHFIPEDTPPTILSVKQMTENIVEIAYNSFDIEVKDLSIFLSRTLHTKAVVNVYQSISDACGWTLYNNGELLRAIVSAQFELSKNIGSRLDFEGEQPGKNMAEDGEDPWYGFGSEDMDSYNAAVGIPVKVYQNSEPNWQNFRIDYRKPSQPTKSAWHSNTNPWWKFW